MVLVEKPPAKPLGIKGIVVRVLLAVIPLASSTAIDRGQNALFKPGRLEEGILQDLVRD